MNMDRGEDNVSVEEKDDGCKENKASVGKA
jgi:hypothetical protein